MSEVRNEFMTGSVRLDSVVVARVDLPVAGFWRHWREILVHVVMVADGTCRSLTRTDQVETFEIDSGVVRLPRDVTAGVPSRPL